MFEISINKVEIKIILFIITIIFFAKTYNNYLGKSICVFVLQIRLLSFLQLEERVILGKCNSVNHQLILKLLKSKGCVLN